MLFVIVRLLSPSHLFVRPSSGSTTVKTPRRPYEAERIDSEMMLVGEYGLKTKREIWRVRLVLAQARKTARTLLTLDDKDERRIFEGNALLRRLHRYLTHLISLSTM